MKPRYLTKSRFKLAMECPTKLYYTGKKEYANSDSDDPFLQALAEGGFQVGELAKFYYQGGHDIETLDYDQALKETNELLQKENCIIYEAAIKYNNFFIRTDILVKEGNRIKVIEVKSKSTSETGDSEFVGKRGGILAAWEPYVNDIAFQNYVVKKALPEYEVMPYLMLVNKNSLCPTDGLNQKFKISRDKGGRKYAVVSKRLREEDLSNKLLIAINTDDVCNMVYEKEYEYLGQKIKFTDLINKFAEKYRKNQLIEPQVSKNCKDCEFKASESEIRAGLKSGYYECFKRDLKWEESDFKDGNIFDIWNFRKTDRYINDGKIKLSQLDIDDINPKPDGRPGISNSERQWKQVRKVKKNDSGYWLDKGNLEKEIKTWTYPLHFIDFETAMPAIPFNKGRRPYEGIAFQFSHHMVYEDGRVEHRSEYLNTEPGIFPNYEFIRELKSQLENDQGTIFRYAAHENTYLNMIYRQLKSDKSHIRDKDELCNFIREITQYRSGGQIIKGPRNMVDMLELVKRYYYDPYMKGSNSIKALLPAILNRSEFLKEKYSKPIYGAEGRIKSLNFKDWTWVKLEDGNVLDPYKLLPRIFDDFSDEDYETMALDQEISDGGAAMTAYSRLQFEEISNNIRESIEKGLLKYCELDTLAMVMIYEAWLSMIE